MAILIPSIQGAVNHGAALRKAVVQSCQYAKRNAVFSGNDSAVTDLIAVFKAHKTLVETRPPLDAVHLGPFQGLGWPDFRKQAYHCRAWANGEASKSALLAFWDGALAELGESGDPLAEGYSIQFDHELSSTSIRLKVKLSKDGQELEASKRPFHLNLAYPSGEVLDFELMWNVDSAGWNYFDLPRDDRFSGEGCHVTVTAVVGGVVVKVERTIDIPSFNSLMTATADVSAFAGGAVLGLDLKYGGKSINDAVDINVRVTANGVEYGPYAFPAVERDMSNAYTVSLNNTKLLGSHITAYVELTYKGATTYHFIKAEVPKPQASKNGVSA